MIIDCHGHCTTVPAAQQEIRDAQVAALADPYSSRTVTSSIPQNWLMKVTEMGLALSARRQGRYEQVSAHLTKWLDLLRGTDGEPGLALVLAELGFAAEQRGDAEAALRLHREA